MGSEGSADPPFPVTVVCSYVDRVPPTEERTMLGHFSYERNPPFQIPRSATPWIWGGVQWRIQVGSEGSADPPFPVTVVCSYVDRVPPTEERTMLGHFSYERNPPFQIPRSATGVRPKALLLGKKCSVVGQHLVF